MKINIRDFIQSFFGGYSQRWRNVVFLFVLLIANLIVYWPSFFHIPRRDHVWWLMEMGAYEGFWDLFWNAYSWSRTRVIFVGDEFLFRPFLYGYLALCKSLFGLNSFGWQLWGIVLHVGTMAALLKICQKMTKSFWVHFFLFCCSLSFVLTPMVTWPHIHGYMAALILLLYALDAFGDYWSGHREALPRMVILLVAASFFCEFTLFFIVALFCVAFFGVIRGGVFTKERDLKPILFWLIFVVFFYGVVAVLDLSFHRGTIYSYAEYGKHFSAFFSWDGIGRFVVLCFGVVKTFFMAWIFPIFLNIQMEMNPRIMLPDGGELAAGAFSDIYRALNMWAVCLILMICFIIVRKISKRGSFDRNHGQESYPCIQRPLFMTVVSLLVLVFYVVMITGGRIFASGIDYLDRSYYYFYTMFAFVFLAAVGVCVHLQEKYAAFSSMWVKSFAVIAGFCCVVANGSYVFAYNKAIEHLFQKEYAYILHVEKFVNSHKHEPDFSFRILATDIDDTTTLLLGKEKKVVKVRVNDMIFSRYVDFNNPRYYLVYRSGRLSVFSSETDALSGQNPVKVQGHL